MTGTLILGSLSMSYAKSYDLVFDTPVKAGSLDLKPGEYSLQVKGNTAVFTNVDTSRSYTAPVKIENATTKHAETAVVTNDRNNTNRIQKIELGGSATDLEFGE
jgi:hypothetical protein